MEDQITVEELEKQLSEIDKKAMSIEIFQWLIDNAEHYIDTMTEDFSLSFLANDEIMPETVKVEKLCNDLETMEIEVTGAEDQLEDVINDNPDIEEAARKQTALNEFMEEVRVFMDEDLEYKGKILDKFMYFHDFVGYRPVEKEDGTIKAEEIIKDMTGSVEISYLSFENMSMDVSRIAHDPVYDDDGNIVSYEKDEAKREIVGKIPPSFCIDMSVSVWENHGSASIF